MSVLPRRVIRVVAGAVASVALTTVLVAGSQQAASAAPVSGVIGSILPVGDAQSLGGPTGRPAIAVVPTKTGHGYWMANADGSVDEYGDALDHGTAANDPANPVVDIAVTPLGDGYWLVRRDGTVEAFGAAPVLGSAADVLGRPASGVVAAAPTPTGNGYWLATRDGGVLSFGDAAYAGSPAELGTVDPAIVGLAITPTGKGYWLTNRDGAVFAFGDAQFAGSLGSLGTRPKTPVTAIVASPATVGPLTEPATHGYWIVTADGTVTAFGAAAPLLGPPTSPAPIAAAAANVGGTGLWLVTGGRPLGDFVVTCYALRGTTRSGRPVSSSTVAVDPRSIPLGTQLFVAGDGFRVATDTGGNIKGRRLDIWKPSSAECRQFGRQVMTVYTVA